MKITATFGQRKKLVPTLIGLFLTALIFYMGWSQPPVVERLNNLVFDNYQRIKPREYKPDEAPVRIIEIDDESIEKLGQWPWPRNRMAKLHERLNQAGAAVIAYDIVFSEKDRTSPENILEILKENPRAGEDFSNIENLVSHDRQFSVALSESNTVLGFFTTTQENDQRPEMSGRFSWGGTPLSNVPNYFGSIPPLAEFEAQANGIGFVTIKPPSDGVIRSAPMIFRMGEDTYRSLSLEALRTAIGAGVVILRMTDGTEEFGASSDNAEITKMDIGDFTFPTQPDGSLRVYYTAHQNGVRVVPAWKILSDDIPIESWADKVAGHIVYIGASAIGLKDLRSTPIRDNETGAMIHAQVTEQIITGDHLTRLPQNLYVELFILLICGLFLSFVLPRVRAYWGAIISALLALGVYYHSWYSFSETQTLYSPVAPLLAILTIYLLMTIASYYLTEKDRSQIRNAFSMYLSPAMVKRVSNDPSLLTLGGEERNMTVLFLDVRSFSRISESMEPEEITTFLNIFLTPMTNILQKGGATIDKYIGDAIVAFWNAPLDDPDHERNAALTVVKMNDELTRLNEKYMAQDEVKWPESVSVGIGLNTGVCCVGNLGSEQRFSYSMIGDAANLASRIEGLTKQYKLSVLIGESTARALNGFAVLEADHIQVVGRETPERIFYLAGDETVAGGADFIQLSKHHTTFLEAYRAQEWKTALGEIKTLRPLAEPIAFARYYDVMAERISKYQKNPPPKDWGGIFKATSK